MCIPCCKEKTRIHELQSRVIWLLLQFRHNTPDRRTDGQTDSHRTLACAAYGRNKRRVSYTDRQPVWRCVDSWRTLVRRENLERCSTRSTRTNSRPSRNSPPPPVSAHLYSPVNSSRRHSTGRQQSLIKTSLRYIQKLYFTAGEKKQDGRAKRQWEPPASKQFHTVGCVAQW